jgi:hypothetical protein
MIRYELEPISAGRMKSLFDALKDIDIVGYPLFWSPEIAFNPEAFDQDLSWIYPIPPDCVKVVVEAGYGYGPAGRPSKAYFFIPCEADAQPAPQNTQPPPKPFGQAVGEVYRFLKQRIQNQDGLDGSVKETVTKELGDLAEKHENKKPWPGMLP